jgi:hypothetical protein
MECFRTRRLRRGFVFDRWAPKMGTFGLHARRCSGQGPRRGGGCGTREDGSQDGTGTYRECKCSHMQCQSLDIRSVRGECEPSGDIESVVCDLTGVPGKISMLIYPHARIDLQPSTTLLTTTFRLSDSDFELPDSHTVSSN